MLSKKIALGNFIFDYCPGVDRERIANQGATYGDVRKVYGEKLGNPLKPSREERYRSWMRSMPCTRTLMYQVCIFRVVVTVSYFSETLTLSEVAATVKCKYVYSRGIYAYHLAILAQLLTFFTFTAFTWMS